jgi:diamine N-acetyltransferase
MAIELVQISPANHKAVRALSVRPEQAHLVAGVDASLADAYVWQGAMFRAACEHDVPVGYVLIYPFDRDGLRIVNIVRLMVDARHQGRGLGRAILSRTLEWISALSPPPDALRVSTLPENEVALGLYLSMGFEIRGSEEGEVALYRLPLSK